MTEKYPPAAEEFREAEISYEGHIRSDIKASSDMNKFREVLAKSRSVVIITGAGISAESGVPTFRGEGGLWRKYQVQRLATMHAFKKSPSLVWEFYHYRRESLLDKKPNVAHLSIAEYERVMEKKNRVVTVLTQNVDGLHQAAGSRNVLEIHGSLFKTQCIPCGYIADNRDSPICESLRGRGAPDLKEDLAEIPQQYLPRCKKPGCNGLLRPYIVWFGENLHADVMEKANDAMSECDLCLVVGTSSVVHPVAWWGPKLAEEGVTVAEFNLERTGTTQNFKFHFRGNCSETIPAALDNIFK